MRFAIATNILKGIFLSKKLQFVEVQWFYLPFMLKKKLRGAAHKRVSLFMNIKCNIRASLCSLFRKYKYAQYRGENRKVWNFRYLKLIYTKSVKMLPTPINRGYKCFWTADTHIMCIHYLSGSPLAVIRAFTRAAISETNFFKS